MKTSKFNNIYMCTCGTGSEKLEISLDFNLSFSSSDMALKEILLYM
jgi:hypothetical protein